MHDCDLAVVGSGFGGSILALIARRLGLRVMLLERGRHPRFAIGESASPLAGVLIEQLADRYGLPRLRPLATYGGWKRTYPEITCGAKRGFSFFRHIEGQKYARRADRANELLVAASPNLEVSDTHWLRADVDHFLVREAIALGADYLDGLHLDEATLDGDGVRLGGRRDGARVRITAPFVVDASGPGGFLSRTLNVRNVGFDDYPGTQALFSHFTGVARCDEMPDYDVRSLVTPGVSRTPPYPLDDAALHHVFDGGWMWVLRFDNGVTSAGVAVTDAMAAELRLADGAPAWSRLLARYPTIAAQFADARPVREFTWLPRLAWRTAAAAGERWALLPSAAGFVDPLFSTGIPLTLLGIERLARMFEHGRGAAAAARLRDYGAVTLAEADHTARYIAGCYAAFRRFEAFTAYSMFYFAAASYSETARRLGAAGPSSRFLCADRGPFAEAIQRLSPATHKDPDSTLARYASAVAAAVDPVNVAGLCDAAKRNWYGVELDDTVRAAAKLGVSAEDVIRATTPLFGSLPE